MNRKPKIRLVKPDQKKPYNLEKASHGVLRRTTFIMLLFGVLLFLPLVWQLFKLMILDHDKYESGAIDNQTRTSVIHADRGVIYDRNMKRLAYSTEVETIFIDPWEIHNAKEDVDFIAENLAAILDVKADGIREKAGMLERRYEVIARQQPWTVTKQVRTFISENHLTGIHLEPDTKREYATPAAAAQVIGFTGADNNGAEGLEAYYDKLLQGTPGALITTKGNYETEMLYSYEKLYEASDGCSLVLTIDYQVQRYLEKNLKAGIEKNDVKNGGFAIMMDVNTGAILGMAIEGSFDPNNYLEVTDLPTKEELNALSEAMEGLDTDSDEYKSLRSEYLTLLDSAQKKQWRNRCVSDGYEPGSTFKTITLAAALDAGAVNLNNSFTCTGKKDYPDRDATLHCWKDEGHGTETTAEALQNSCNIAFADIGLLLGGDRFYDYIDAFGLLEKTGVDMSGEQNSIFHTKAKLMENAQLTTVAFGQSVKPTPIQMVRAIAAVVNGGYVVEPYVVSEVLDGDGNVIEKHGTTVLRQAISAETSALMCQLMESVVTDGTAGNAKLAGYHIGGKTGTSEKLDVLDENGNPTTDRIVSFVGVAPMDNPQYICLVALDSPSKDSGLYISGGVMAAPVVRDIFADTLLYLGVQPDYTGVDMSTVNVQMPDVRQLTVEAAGELLAEQSLTYITVGSGETVTGQIPAPGNLLPGESEVILYMGEEVPTDKVVVPDLHNLTPAQANEKILNSGLYIQTKGSSWAYAVVTGQDYEPGEEVPRGTMITLEMTDKTALD